MLLMFEHQRLSRTQSFCYITCAQIHERVWGEGGKWECSSYPCL